MSSAPTPPFPKVRRLVTGHTESGHSTFESIDDVEPYVLRGSEAVVTDLYWADANRPDISGQFQDTAKEHHGELCGKEGIVVRVLDSPPGSGGNLVSWLKRNAVVASN